MQNQPTRVPSFSHVKNILQPHPVVVSPRLLHGRHKREIPGTEDRLMVGLRTEEVGSVVASYDTVFDIQGRILLSDTKIGNRKYEGLEFL